MSRSVLVVGGGGRTHALAEAIRNSDDVSRVILAPGTSALQRRGYETVPVSSRDFAGLAEVAMMEEVDLTVVGPNTPLVQGIVDYFDDEELPIFGPTRRAAMLEGSKAWARLFENQLRLPMPKMSVCRNADAARDLARRKPWPRVFKADGLGYGKGVRVVNDASGIEQALADVTEDNPYLESEQIVVEERLDGVEVTLFTLTDGEDLQVLGSVRNHPRLLDGERGPPTRSMGQVSPAPEVTPKVEAYLRDEVIVPTLNAMAERGRRLRGALFLDLIFTRDKPVVIDFNVRFGDPATQTLLSGYTGDFLTALDACRHEGQLTSAVSRLTRDPRPRVSLVLVAEGYPMTAVRGDVISIDEEAFDAPDVWLYEDGVRWVTTGEDAPRLETTGGRTYTIVVAADAVEDARKRVYELAGKIEFRGMHYRRDMGQL